MTNKVISTDKAPSAIGPYSQGMIVGNMVFTSGQIPINPATGELISDIKEATRQSLNNVKAILEEAGTSLDNAVKMGVFVKDMNDFSVINEVYAEFFGENPPARSLVEVARLPKDAVIEIEAIALIK